MSAPRRKRPPALRNAKTRGSSLAKIDYTYQKVIGARNGVGSTELLTLKPVHKEMIAMHLTGSSVKDIAKKLHFSEAYVSRTLTCKSVKPYIDSYHDVITLNISALASKAIEVLQTAMENGTTAEKTVAAKEVLKLNDRYPKDDKDPPDGQNAADIVKDVINLARDVMDVRRVERSPQAQIIDNDGSFLEGEA